MSLNGKTKSALRRRALYEPSAEQRKSLYAALDMCLDEETILPLVPCSIAKDCRASCSSLCQSSILIDADLRKRQVDLRHVEHGWIFAHHLLICAGSGGHRMRHLVLPADDPIATGARLSKGCDLPLIIRMRREWDRDRDHIAMCARHLCLRGSHESVSARSTSKKLPKTEFPRSLSS